MPETKPATDYAQRIAEDAFWQSPLLPERFWAKVTLLTSGCWAWTGCKRRQYGCFWYEGEYHQAHRVAYKVLIEPIPQGRVSDHLCRNRWCVNPVHLEMVTNQTNVLRGVGISAQNAKKTHCKNGHSFDGENTYLYQGKRYCRMCHRISRRASDRRRRARAKANATN